MKKILALTAIAAAFAACNGNDTPSSDPSIAPPPSNTPAVSAPKTISYAVISQYPHDTSSFTEGLEFHNGKLYESGGELGESRIQYGDVKTGKIEKKHSQTPDIFAEGITFFKGKLYQLTYQTHQVFVYDEKDITKPIKTLSWPAEGWGLTNNGTDLILDAGNNNLYFVDPETFAIRKTLPVVDNAGPVNMINELEYVDGFIWANIWQTNRIIKIDPQTGYVVGEMYLNNMLQPGEATERTDVLNGIAYDSASKTMFFTGKRWPKIFEVRIN